ncbi:MAG: sulfite exporter TauE/SafE family protein [Holosporales bacterium]|nr:sulfite exporter TauE/SafE family protein [Holosporales bacterium]
MFSIFFPISGVSLNPLLILGTGVLGGIASGFLGVGCGVVITPFLMEFGIPPLTAVSTQLCHATATNFSNFLSYRRSRDVDFYLTMYILLGGIVGAAFEWLTLKLFHGTEIILQKFVFVYIATLFIFGVIMLRQSTNSIRIGKNKPSYRQTFMMRRWMLYLPIHKIFKRSRVEMSIFVPLFVGFLAGTIVTSTGGGNNLFTTPILTYLIGRISPVVRGTTSLTGFVISVIVTIVYAERGYNCDFFFVAILFLGAAFGIWIGKILTRIIKKEYINIIAALSVFIIATRMVIKTFFLENSFLVDTPQDMSNSIIYNFTSQSPVMYAIACISLICLAAVFFEKLLRKITKREDA